MFIAIKVAVLSALIRLLLNTDKPLWCAIIYTVFVALMNIFFTTDILSFLIVTGLSFVLSFIYFFLLARYSESWGFWLIAVGGLFIGLV